MDTLDALLAPVPREVIATRMQGGQKIAYIPWHDVARLLNARAPGWQWEIKSSQVVGDYLVLVGRLTIPTPKGPVVREATGCEPLSVAGYGDPASNAEAMALRRAAAKFGLGLELYRKSR